MPQLVGMACAVCSGRIPSELDGAFCGRCQNAVHNRCRRSDSSSAPGTCPDCGADLEAAERLARERAAREREARGAVVPPPLGVERMIDQYHATKAVLLLAGGLLVALTAGITLIASGETGLGLTLLIGVPGVLGLFILAGLRRRR